MTKTGAIDILFLTQNIGSVKMKKKILRVICILLCFTIIFVSICFFQKEKPANQQIEITESTAVNNTVVESSTELVTEADTATEFESTTETTTQLQIPTVTIPPLENSPVSANSGELGNLVRQVAEKYGAVGVQVATIKDGVVSSTAESGWAIVDEMPMTADTKIRIASLSKTVVGMVAFKLIEDDKLSLDADISEYLGVEVKHPEYPEITITLRMLLTHTSGITDKGYQNSLEEIREFLKTPEAYRDKPGEIYRYNNYGFGLVGTICECVTNRSLNALAKQYFIKPMGLKASFLGGQLDKNKVANLYNNKGEITLSVADSTDLMRDDTKPGSRMMLYPGGLITSATDFARLLTLFINDGMYNGVELLSKESIALMHTPNLPKSAVQCMPMKRMNGMYKQDYMYYHTGSAYGVYSLYVYNPETKTGVVVVTTGAKAEKDIYGIYAVCGDIVKGIIENNLF